MSITRAQIARQLLKAGGRTDAGANRSTASHSTRGSIDESGRSVSSGGGGSSTTNYPPGYIQQQAAARAKAKAKVEKEKTEDAFEKNRFNYNRPNKINRGVLKAISYMPTISRLTGITPDYLDEQDEIASNIENLALGNYNPGSIGSQYFGPFTDAAMSNYKSTVGGFPTRDTGGGGDGGDNNNYIPPVYVQPTTADTAATTKDDEEANPFTAQFTRAALTDADRARINEIGGLSIFAANGGRIGYDMGGEVMDQELQAGAPNLTIEGNQIPQQEEQASMPDIDAELYQLFMDALRKGDIPQGTTFDTYKQLMMQMMSQQQGEQMQPEMQEGIMQAQMMEPEREMAAYGGIMGLDGRRAYGFGSVFKSISRPFKKAASAIKKVAKSPIGKAALLYAGGTYLGGTSLFSGPASAKFTGGNFFSTLGKRMANPGLLKRLYNPAFLQSTAGSTLSATPSVTAGLGAEEFARATYANQYNKLKALNPVSKGNFVTNLFKNKATGAIDPLKVFAGITAAGVGAGLYTAKTQEDEESLQDILGARDKTSMDLPGIRKYIADNMGNIDPNEYAYLSKASYAADGGRIGYANGGGDVFPDDDAFSEPKMSREDMAQRGQSKIYDQYGSMTSSELKKLLENLRYQRLRERYSFGVENLMQNNKAEGGLMNLGGNEMDLRGGGFVPLGAKEKADDVPARLSKNEFVFTADAVRAAGGGSVDKGAEKMYNTMKRLEGVVA